VDGTQISRFGRHRSFAADISDGHWLWGRAAAFFLAAGPLSSRGA
jgi:hypothetical protein